MATELDKEQKTTIGVGIIGPMGAYRYAADIRPHFYAPGLEYTLPIDRLHYDFEDEDGNNS